MMELLGSHTKELILLYLGLRGGISGRKLAQKLRLSPTPVFKALRQLVQAGVIKQNEKVALYSLDSDYPFYKELVSIIRKTAELSPKLVQSFMINFKRERQVDAEAVYEFVEQRPKLNIPYEKLSDRLVKIYAR